MTTTGTTQAGEAKAAGKNAIRPFTVSVPEAELTELRERIAARRVQRSSLSGIQGRLHE